VCVVAADRTVCVVRSDQTLVAIREAGWLPAPTDVRVTPGPDRVTVDWRDNSTEEIGYRVELCNTLGRCFLENVVAANTTRATLRRLPIDAGRAYYARVMALGAAGPGNTTSGMRGGGAASDRPLSPDTNWASQFALSELAAALPGELTEVRGLTATATYADVIQLEWRYEADASQLEGFDIRRALSAQGPFTTVAFAGADARTYDDRDLLPSIQYYYEVVAVSEGSSSDPVGANATTKAATLRTPSELTVTVGNESFTLRWRDNANDETGFIVQRRGVGSDKYETVGILSANSRSFTDSAYLTRGTYSYRVKAVGKTADSPYVLTAATLGGPKVASLYLPFAQQRR
jgi:hypothetical protein